MPTNLEQGVRKIVFRLHFFVYISKELFCSPILRKQLITTKITTTKKRSTTTYIQENNNRYISIQIKYN